MKTFKTVCVSLLFISCAACTKSCHFTENAGETVSCTCDEFPFRAECKTQCQVGNATVEAVDEKQQTATVKIQNGSRTLLKTVRLSELPNDVPPKIGSAFATLMKKNVNASEKSEIVRFIKPQK